MEAGLTELAGFTSNEPDNTEIGRPAAEAGPEFANTLDLLRWHLDRYDRLRASTAARAGVVLSAAAILFAGNAIVVSRLVDPVVHRHERWIVGILLAATLTTAYLILLSLLRAADVLVTPRASRVMFVDDDSVPASLVFNGGDTVKRVRGFAAFRSVLMEQSKREVLEAAQVELWICIQQHRHRYLRLRSAVRVLRFAAVSLAVVMAGVLSADVLLT